MRSNRLRLSTLGVALAMTVAFAAGCGNSNINNQQTPGNATSNTVSSVPDKTYSGPVVATYSGGSLTKQELDEQYNLQVVLPGQQSNESKKDFVTYYLVFYKYVYNEATKQMKPTIDATQAGQLADKELQALATNPQSPYKNQQEVTAKMKELNITRADLVNYFEKYQVIEAFYNAQIKGLKPTDAQMLAYYKANPENFTNVTAHHILVATPALANKIEGMLKSGANFESLAKKYSTDTGSGAQGGLLPDSPVSQYVPPFAKACMTLPIGQISAPVHSQFGYHIIRVDKRTVTPYSKAKSTIESQLLQNMQQAKEKQIYNSAIKAANIKITAKDADL